MINRSLSQASREETGNLVQIALDDANSLSKRIRDMELELKELKKAHTAKIDYINRNSSHLSPIRRLPIELQQLIFEYTVLSSEISTPLSALTISSVCGQWRKLALRTSSLWSHIFITLPKFPFPHPFYWVLSGTRRNERVKIELNTVDLANWEGRTHKLLERAQTFATRSRTTPLRLVFDAKKAFDLVESDHPEMAVSKMFDEVYALIQPLVDFVCEIVPRCQCLNLSLPAATPATNFLQLLKVVNRDLTPRLRESHIALDLRRFYVTDRSNFQELRETMEKSRRNYTSFLQDSEVSFSLNLHSMCPEYFCLPISWLALTSLTLHCRGSEFEMLEPLDPALIILSLLSNCPSLENCDFSLPTVWILDEEPMALGDIWSRKVIQLPHLKTLRIRQISNVPLGLAKAFDLPELKELTLTSTPWFAMPRETSQSSLVEWVERFGHSLTKATIHYVDLTQDALYECLKRLPQVSILRLSGERGVKSENCAYLSTELLQVMNGAGVVGGKVLCPNLETFHCALGHSEDLNEEDICAFIAARRPKQSSCCPAEGVSPNRSEAQAFLRDVRVKFYGDRGAPRLDVGNELRERGKVDVNGFCFSRSYGSIYLPPWLDQDSTQGHLNDPSLEF